MTSRAAVETPAGTWRDELARLAALPHFLPLTAAVLLVGIRDGMTLPYLTLFGIERAHLAPIPLGVFLTLRSVGGVLISMVLGHWLDRRPSLWPLMLALLFGSLGYGLLATTTNFVLLLLIATLPLGASSAAFAQLFALARGHLDGTDRVTVERGIGLLRAGFSAAWAIGPAIGAAMVEFAGYTGLLMASAVFGLLAYAAVAGSRVRAPASGFVASRVSGSMWPTVIAAAASFTLFAMAMSMGSVALPVVVVHDLEGSRRAVGLMASLCALLEVPVMVAVAMWPKLFGGFWAIVGGFLIFTLYFLVAAWAPSIPVAFLSQLLRAIGIGLVTCVGISYMQDLMPGRIGTAAALYSNTGQVGAMLAGLAAGGWADLFGFRSMFFACAALTGLGLAFLIVDRARRFLRVETPIRLQSRALIIPILHPKT